MNIRKSKYQQNWRKNSNIFFLVPIPIKILLRNQWVQYNLWSDCEIQCTFWSVAVSNKHILSVSKQFSMLNVCHMKVTWATNIPKHVLVKCCWAKSVRGVPALCEEATHLSPPLFFHCLIFFAFVFQGFLSMSKWYVKYFCHLYISIAMHCIVWSSFHVCMSKHQE